MTMRISSRQLIGGIPITRIRTLLARCRGAFRQDWLIYRGYSTEQSAEIVRDLLAGGFIVRNERRDASDSSGIPWFSTTDLGKSLIRATAAKPIHRRTADNALKAFMQRVSEVNESPRFLVRVTEVVVYGSYLTGVERLGDLDLACRFESKIHDPEQRDRAYEEHWDRSGRTYRRELDEYFWPQTEVLQFLKHRQRTISLHYMSDFISMDKTPNFRYQVVMGDAECIAQRLQKAQKPKWKKSGSNA